ncbi:MAG: hypothetical protein IKO21_11935 [Fibrobacter sp.]|nr:hypothetical protein [Fibrobacter sp.]
MAILAASAMAAEETSSRDRSKLSIFLQPAVSFLDFPEREYFQNAIDTLYHSFRQDALTESESLSVAKQDFQKVNFCFPISAGIQYQIFPDNFISAGLSFIYDNESVVLTDRKNRTHNYSYTIQGMPLFLEYRLGIPRNLMTLSGESLFSVAVRWYWVLPGTEIYTTWGGLEAKIPAWGAGFGVSVGYLIASWRSFNIYGDIGFSSIKVSSNRTYAHIVPDGPDKKASWNIGGLTMQVRVGFGLWNEPEPVEDKDDDDDVPETDLAPRAASQDSATAETTTAEKADKAEDAETKTTEATAADAAETDAASATEAAASEAETAPAANESAAAAESKDTAADASDKKEADKATEE